MLYSVRATETICKGESLVDLAAMQRVILPETLTQVVRQHQARFRRVRKLDLTTLIWVLIGMHLVAQQSFPRVLRALSQWTRLFSADPDQAVPSSGAIATRRRQMGGKPMQDLFHAVCRPLATPQTPGAWAFGLRLVGLDGSIDNLLNTPANARVYTRKGSQRGTSAFPQILGVYLVECGTHAIFDVGFWPGTTSEHRAAPRLVRAVTAEMLVLWDRGFHSYALITAMRARGAHVLGRLPAHVKPCVQQALPDGSWLAELRDPATRQPSLRVRVVGYHVGEADPIWLVTTLLDADVAPAQALAQTYHERWEVELVFDELGTHLGLAQQTLRSQTPCGVIQELYGLLLAHFVVRTLMHTAALHAGIDSDRLSFTAAVDLVATALSEFALVAPQHADALFDRLLRQIAQARVPARRVRHSPRTVCRSRSKFKQKSADHPCGRRQSGADLLTIQANPPNRWGLPDAPVVRI